MGYWRMRWVWERYVLSLRFYNLVRESGITKSSNWTGEEQGPPSDVKPEPRRKTEMREEGEKLTLRQSNQYPS